MSQTSRAMVAKRCTFVFITTHKHLVFMIEQPPEKLAAQVMGME